MKKLLCVLCSVVILSFSSCTAENNKKPLICEEVSVIFSDGGYEVYAAFTTSGENTMTDGKTEIKKYRGKTASEALKNMIDSEKDAMFKPIKRLILEKNSPYNSEIARAFVNRSELQLKCEVYETDDRSVKKHDGGIPFSEYYRKTVEGVIQNGS